MESEMGRKKWSNILYFYRYAYREIPRMAFYHFYLVAGGILLPFFGILMPGIVLSAAEKGEMGRGLAVIGAAGFLILVCNALMQQVKRKNYFYENLFRTIMLGDMVLKETRCLYRYVEYDEQRKMTKRVYQSMGRGDRSVSYQMLNEPRKLLVCVVCFFLYSTVLGTLQSWLVALLLILSFVNYGVLQRKNKWQLALRKEFAQSDREIHYLNRVFRDTAVAKDVRIFAMNHWLLSLRKKIFGERVALEKRNNRKMILADFLQLMLGLLRDGFAYGYLIRACLRGEISAAGFLVYFGAIGGFSGFVTDIADTWSRLKLANEDASCLRAYMELPETDGLTDRQGVDSATLYPLLYRQPAEIEFQDVSFSYGEHKIYDHFNLRIAAGEKVALLGVNGAGKTTLVKLLCGLYEPDAGQILINGVDIATLPRRTLYDLFSVIFQEAAVLPYPVGCNLSLRKLSETDGERARAALRKAGLEKTFQERGIRMDFFMTKAAFRDGVELSGGETQRLFLARAIYKDGNIWILDEPTSALDPIAESQVYEEYVKLCEGKTSLFISHRLASTRFSDRILFLEDGRIREEGTHEELMALGGSYAHMFEVQSHYYVRGKGLPVCEGAGKEEKSYAG